ncbi:MAG: Geranylgeranyl reductase flavoprotein [Candidatus Methanohalarchaeum thermophilum]|uniref:Digeranylgeranylglycerophospholipid reductase n=1 Tax=Methanohalarchaeum thermophilum TaxID=1903181 RepID=A0A1Q6DWA8_METT1|nr:MAG: Geranylgeranyl reductase flavoprotein [Candidatus Methanohalarchaeum thermophilum]
MNKNVEYDLIIVGGGPAGAYTGKIASKLGLETLIVEKRQEIGSPVRCAEGVGKKIEEYVNVAEEALAKDVKGARIYSPSNNYIDMLEEDAGAEVGYILNRKVFDQKLVEEAIKAGADVKLKTRASEFEQTEDGIRVKLVNNGASITLESKILIGADGVESLVGKKMDIYNNLKLNEIESCAQFLMTGINGIDLDYTHFYVGNEVAPGGYAWIFPKGDKKANVGIGILPNGTDKSAYHYLKKFVEQREYLKNAKILEEIYGGVPVASPLEEAVDDNVMLVGDSARQSDPLTGGGILNAIKAGKIAGEVAKEAIESNNCKKDFLKRYDERRLEEIGQKNERNYDAKELFQKLSDEELNSLISSLEEVSFESLSVTELVSELIKTNPWLSDEIDGFID